MAMKVTKGKKIFCRCPWKKCPISSTYAKVMTVLWRDHHIRIPRGVTIRV